MKKNFVQKLALGLALVMTVTSVPATSEAAAKPAFKTASVTVTEGETVKAVVKGTKGYTFKKVVSKNETVATAALKKVKAKKVKINVTGVKAGETKVVAKLAKGGKVVKAKLAVTVEAAKVESVPEIKSLEATKVNVLTATFASAVNTEDVALAVTKDGSKVETTVIWNADKTVATITTTSKLRKGTYTLTATAASDSVSKTATVAVEDQAIAEIKILNTVALTGKGTINSTPDTAGAVAYVYYDVVDQYGESLKASTSITWSTSCGTPMNEDRTLGKLTLKRSDDKAFTYGEQIFVAGVNAQTGKSVNATLTVGAEQALNTVTVEGFVKKNTTEILSTIPAGFKDEAYYMIYSVADQNGNAMPAANYYSAADQQVTFISDNVLVIEKFEETTTLVTINGVTYSAVEVVPGMYVDQGGEVNITAIANKTGNKNVLNVVVGANPILQSFVMSSPELIADGETVEIPFVAMDTTGKEITNFSVLADNINKLTFNANGATLTLAEEDDGTASLWLTDNKKAWGTDSADGIDRPIALTAIVVGGETHNLMVNVKDKARPDAIYSVNAPEVMVEGATNNLSLAATQQDADARMEATFTFLDQYGRKIKNKVDYVDSTNNIDYKYNDNGFFAYASNLSNTEFNGYNFGIKVTYTGNAGAASTNFNTVNGKVVAVLTPDSETATLAAPTNVIAALTGENLKFEIVKEKAADSTDEWSAVSTAYNTTFSVVDITQVKNFMVLDLNKQFADTNKATDDMLGADAENGAVNASGNDMSAFNQYATVIGFYNGKTVVVPAEYLGASADVVTAVTMAGIGVVIQPTVQSGVELSKFYDFTTAKTVRKDASDNLTVTINEVYGENAGELYDTVVKGFTVSNAKAVPTTIVCEDSYTYYPTDTAIITSELDPEVVEDNYRGDIRGDEDGKDNFVVKDQYGKPITADIYYQISKVVENAAGYAENNFKVTGNASKVTATGGGASIVGAERGDTFVLTIIAKVGDDSVSKDVAITVGADSDACIVNGINYYYDTLLFGTGNLNDQRVATLQ